MFDNTSEKNLTCYLLGMFLMTNIPNILTEVSRFLDEPTSLKVRKYKENNQNCPKNIASFETVS